MSFSDRNDPVWLLIVPHIGTMYENRYVFKFTTLTDFFSSLPHTNIIRSFSFTSSTTTYTPNFVTWSTRAIWGKEWEWYLGLGILQSITFVSWPLDLQRLLCFLYHQPTVFMSILGSRPLFLLLSACLLLQLPFCTQVCRTANHRAIWVGWYKLWVAQSWAALCRCLPGACYESSENCRASTYFPLETVPPDCLVRLIVLRL